MKDVTVTDEGIVMFVAYIEAAEKKKYLGDGKGNVRMFKSEEMLREHIRPLLPPEDYARVIVHPVTCKVLVPESEQNAGALLPISTLAPYTTPTAIELLENYVKRKTGKRNRK